MNGLSLCLIILSLGFAVSRPAVKFSFVINKDTTLTIKLGKRAIIDCNTDDQGAKVTLYKAGGTNVVQVVKGPNVSVQNGLFYIQKTLYEDLGRYRCTAVDQLGNVISRTVFILLDTSKAAVAIRPPSHYLKVYAGDDFTLTCETVNIRINSIQWHFKYMAQQPRPQDYTISTKQVTSLVAMSTLHITKAKRGFTGYYQCKNNGYLGQMDEVFVEVIVAKAPSFKKPYHETITVKGRKELDLDCEATGSPKPTISWKRNGLTIPTCKIFFHNTCSDAEYLITATGLKIKNAAFPKDNATFSCVANNEAGTSVKTVDVNIEVPPQLTSKLRSDVLLYSTKPYNITCTVKTANPAPKFTWKMKFPHSRGWITKFVYGFKFYYSKMSTTMTVPFYVSNAEFSCTAINILGKDSTTIKFIRA